MHLPRVLTAAAAALQTREFTLPVIFSLSVSQMVQTTEVRDCSDNALLLALLLLTFCGYRSNPRLVFCSCLMLVCTLHLVVPVGTMFKV